MTSVPSGSDRAAAVEATVRDIERDDKALEVMLDTIAGLQAWVSTVVAAAEPHLTAPYQREIERLREEANTRYGVSVVAEGRQRDAEACATRAEEAVQRVRELCDEAEARGRATLPDGVTLSGCVPADSLMSPSTVRAALSTAGEGTENDPAVWLGSHR